MAEKKRKRQSNVAESPSKKVVFSDTRGQTLKVTYRDDGLAPVLVSSPGLSKPSLPFQAFSRSQSGRQNGRHPSPIGHDLILHTAAHPTLDYLATPSNENKHLSHYIAIHNPSTKSLRIVPAHQVTLKRTLRSEEQDVRESEGRHTIARQREQLASEFGTKKAKKALESKTINAIVDSKVLGKGDDVQSAVLAGIAGTAGAESTEQTLEEQLASKPIPKPNLKAEFPNEVYPLSTLIPPVDMRMIPWKDWQTQAREDQDFTHHFRFFPRRVKTIGQGSDIAKLKALRYLALLLDFNAVLVGGGKAGKKVPKKDVLSRKLATYPEQLVDSVRRRFSNNNELSKFDLDNLYTHMAALSMYIDEWTTNTRDLRDDLRFENKTMSQYFHELGCKVNPPTEKERERFGIKKAEASSIRIARLTLPPEFPKLRTGRRK